jgi:hypothetical protein
VGAHHQRPAKTTERLQATFCRFGWSDNDPYVTLSRARLHPAAYKAYARSQSLRVCLSILHQYGGVFVSVQRDCRSGTVHWASYSHTHPSPRNSVTHQPLLLESVVGRSAFSNINIQRKLEVVMNFAMPVGNSRQSACYPGTPPGPMHLEITTMVCSLRVASCRLPKCPTTCSKWRGTLRPP